MTGGSGPIGLALIRKLLSEGISILLFQRYHSAKRMYLPKNPLLQVEYCSLDELRNYQVKDSDYDVFFHLGWTNTAASMRDNISIQNPNVIYACDAVELAQRLGCHTFIGAGSQSEFGRHNEALCEKTLCIPETAYGVMKLCACYATELVCKQNGIKHMWPRILSGYGIYDNIGSVLISTILKSMNGEKLVFSKGEQIWDFVYLDDIADALFLMAEKGHNGAKYPIGSGEARKLREYLEILCSKLGKLQEAEFGAIPYRDGQIMHLEADISDIQTDTGWKPKTCFEDGIQKTIEFYRTWKPQYEKKYAQLRLEVEGH